MLVTAVPRSVLTRAPVPGGEPAMMSGSLGEPPVSSVGAVFPMATVTVTVAVPSASATGVYWRVAVVPPPYVTTGSGTRPGLSEVAVTVRLGRLVGRPGGDAGQVNRLLCGVLVGRDVADRADFS